MSEFTNLCGIVKDPEYVSNPEKKVKAGAILDSRLSIKSCSKQDRGPGIRIHKYINGAEQRLRNKPHFHSHLISIKGAKSIHRQKASNPEEKSKYSHRGKQAWLLPHSLFCCYNKIPEQRALTMNGSLLANSSVGWDIEEQSTRNCNCVCVCYFLSVLHTHPFPTHPSLCLPLSHPRHFFFKAFKTNSCSPHILGCVALPWRVVNLPSEGLPAPVQHGYKYHMERASAVVWVSPSFFLFLFYYVDESGAHGCLGRK